MTAERETAPPNPAYSGAVQSRYKDAYFFARSNIAAGNFIKGLAAIVAVFIALAAFWAATQTSGPNVAVAGILVGGLVGLSIYLFGMLMAALGQVLIALLDIALNTSPYLDDDTRASAMSLANPSLVNASPKSLDVCPRCGSTEIKLTGRFDPFRGWKCLKCHYLFKP